MQKNSKIFKNIQETFKENPEIFKNLQEIFMEIQKTSKISKEIQKTAKIFRENPENFEYLPLERLITKKNYF